MSLDGAKLRPMRMRRTPADRLRDAVLALGRHRGELVEHREQPWASITFAGARHTLSLLFLGDQGVEAGEDFIAALPDHEFAIPGQIVADAAITACDHRLVPSPRLTVTCELLLLEDA